MIRALILSLVLAVPTASADLLADDARQPGSFGVGLGSGTLANGLSGKYFWSSRIAVQANIGSVGGGGVENRYRRYSGFGVSVDGLVHVGTLWKHRVMQIDLSVGAGPGIGIADDVFGVAVSGVVGLEFNMRIIPLDVVLEYRPGLLLRPEVDFEPVDFTAHIRIYFD